MRILTSLLRAYWKQLIILLILVSCFLYVRSLQRENARLTGIIASHEAIANAQIEHNKFLIAQQEKITADVVTTYAESIDKLKEYYAKNPTIKFKPMRVPVSTSRSEVSDIPTASEGTNADTEGNQSSATESNTVTVYDCASDVLNLLLLQKWVREQSAVN